MIKKFEGFEKDRDNPKIGLSICLLKVGGIVVKMFF
jgi:hypothetical protein